MSCGACGTRLPSGPAVWMSSSGQVSGWGRRQVYLRQSCLLGPLSALLSHLPGSPRVFRKVMGCPSHPLSILSHSVIISFGALAPPCQPSQGEGAPFLSSGHQDSSLFPCPSRQHELHRLPAQPRPPPISTSQQFLQELGLRVRQDQEK